MLAKTFDYEIQLIGLVEGLDDDGYPVNEQRPQPPILANRLSVRSSEYWQARQSGIDLSYMFEVHSFEYNGEEKMLYDGKEYDIVRTFNKGEVTELVCHRKDDDHEA